MLFLVTYFSFFPIKKNVDSGGIRYVENKRTGETDGRCLPGNQKENVTQQFKVRLELWEPKSFSSYSESSTSVEKHFGMLKIYEFSSVSP